MPTRKNGITSIIGCRREGCEGTFTNARAHHITREFSLLGEWGVDAELIPFRGDALGLFDEDVGIEGVLQLRVQIRLGLFEIATRHNPVTAIIVVLNRFSWSRPR
jgi:hypothetical protein